MREPASAKSGGSATVPRRADPRCARDRAPMPTHDPVIDWLLDSDPAIRWQVMRDLLDAPEPDWRAERAKVETEGWGAQLLSCEDEDGQWAGGSFLPRDFDFREWRDVGQPWTATTYALSQLRE